jgi:RecT family
MTTDVDRYASVSLQTLRYLNLDPNTVETRALVAIAQRYRLDPLVGEVGIIATKNGPKVYVSRDGMIALAHRSGQLDGIEVLEERRSTNNDGWTCYVQVWRKDCKYPFKYGAQCKDTELQAKAGNGPEMALARAERRALRRAFAIPLDDLIDVDSEPNTVDADPGEALAVEAPSADALEAEPVPAGLPTDWPATAATVDAVYKPVGGPAEPTVTYAPIVAGRLQGAAHRTVASWTPEKRGAFLDAWGIETFAEPWPSDAVDNALEDPF